MMIRSNLTQRTLSAFALAGLLFGAPSLGLAQDGDAPKTEERPKEAAKAEGKAIDANTLLDRVFKKHAAYKDFSCRVKRNVKVMGMAVPMDITFQYKKAKLFKSVANQMGMKQTAVHDGTTTWLYVDMMNRYQKMGGMGGMILSPHAPFLYSLLTNQKMMIPTAGATAEEATVDGKIVRRLKITNPMGFKISLEFDADDNLVRQTQVMPKDMGAMGGNPQMKAMAGAKIVSTYSEMKTDTGLADDLFKFSPPEGAQEGLGGMPGMPGQPGGGAKPAPAPKSKPAEPKKDDDDDDDF